MEEFKMANLHENCKCQIIDGKLINEPSACDYCKGFNFKEEKLDLVEFKLQKGKDLKMVSIVKNPAIEKEFQLFEAIKPELFQSSVEKQEITGPVMVPNLPILRKKKNGEYYNCWFSTETISECMESYMSNSYHISANFDHNQSFKSDEIFVKEIWQVTDSENDKANALGFTDIKVGSWYQTYKTYNTELFNEIKKSGFTGFSIESFFDHFDSDKEIEYSIFNIIKSNLNDIEKENLIRSIISKQNK